MYTILYLEIFPVLDFHYLCVASGVVSKEQLMLYTILYLEMFLLWIFTKLNMKIVENLAISLLSHFL